MKKAYINAECTHAEKLRWLILSDRLGFKSLSALIRYALTHMEEEHATPPSGSSAQ